MKHVLLPTWVGGSLLVACLPALASCGANGVCGTIVFLGKTADRSKAVFLSTTTTRGQYDVAPTSGVFPVDTWVTTGPDTRISLSDQVATWGGTHALNHYPAEGAPISTRVFIASATQNPNGTVYPNDYRPPGRGTPLSGGGMVSVPQPVRLHVVEGPAVVERQTPQGPVAAQMLIETVAVQEPKVVEPVRGPLVPGPTDTSLRGTATGPAVASVTTPLEAIQVPPVVSVQQTQEPPGISVRTTGAGPVVAPAAHQLVVIQAPQEPRQVQVPIVLDPPSVSVRQTGTGPLVAPSGQQTVTVQGPQALPLVQPPREPVQLGGLPGVVTPPSGGEQGGQGGVLPVRPPVTTGGQRRPTGTDVLPATTGARVPLPGQNGSSQRDHQDDHDHRAAELQAPRSWSRAGPPCARPQPTYPADAGRQWPCAPDETQAGYGTWVDVFSSRTRDDAGGLVLRQRGEGLMAGLDRVIDADLSVGLFANTERLRGSVLDEALRFKTTHTGVGAYVVRAWDARWSFSGGLHVGEETANIGFLGFSGRYRNRTWTASAGVVGTHAFDGGWMVTRFNVEHAWKRTGTGAISGEVAGLRLDVETPASRDAFWMLSGGIALGTRLLLSRGVVVVPSVDLGFSRVAHGSRQANPWHVDVRLGARVQISPATALVLSHHRFGVNRRGYHSHEWRVTWAHQF